MKTADAETEREARVCALCVPFAYRLISILQFKLAQIKSQHVVLNYAPNLCTAELLPCARASRRENPPESC